MRALAFLAGCALAAPAPAPVAAQSAADEAANRIDQRCAIWASALMAMAQEDDGPVEGLGYTMTWFVGRWEGRTGLRIDEAWSHADVDAVVADMPGTSAICLPLMESFGARMTAWGDAIGAYGASLDAAEAAGSSRKRAAQ